MLPRVDRIFDHEVRIRNRMRKTAITDAQQSERSLHTVFLVGSIT